MARIQLTADVVVDDRSLNKFIREALVAQVQELVTKLKPNILAGAQEYIGESIQASPEWKSLLEVSSGERASLRVQLGLENPAPVLAGIVQAVQNGVVIESLPAGGDILGGIRVCILPNDYAAELRVEGAEYPSNQYNIPWLKWLLVGGAGLLVTESEMLYIGDTNHTEKTLESFRRISIFPHSRTGPAVMVQPKHRPSRGWQILPTEFSGTQDNNWLTRSLADGRVGDKIVSLFQKLLTA